MGRGSMSRDEGFAVMDVSTSITDDPKVRKLWRHAPDHAAAAFTAYVATMAESWRSGKRATVDDSWPPFLPFSQQAVEALVHVGLIDSRGMIPTRSWRGWFEPARARRESLREKWRRANSRRHADTAESNGSNNGGTAELPRGSSSGTAAPVPSVRPLRPLRSTPTVKEFAAFQALKDDA
jgi:hypothetical protein